MQGAARCENSVPLDAGRRFLYGTGQDFRTSPARLRGMLPANRSLLNRIPEMSRRCELTGKGVMTGNTVSHAINKTRRRFLPNLLNVTLISDALERSVKLRITAHALRSVEHRGGLDAFLLKASDEELSERAQGLKQEVRAKLAA